MRHHAHIIAAIGILGAAWGLSACEAVETNDPTVPAALDPAVTTDPDLHKPMLPAPLADAKGDSLDGYQGPVESGISAATRVWDVTRSWSEVTPEAGLAWAAHSGLNWDEKYAAWIGALEATSAEAHGDTFELVTPWGKRLPAPRLECAEAAMFLRATFAAWHGLPFYLSAWSPTHGRLYFGHFGIVTPSGASPSAYPRFASAYADHTATFAGMSDEAVVASWPEDGPLRSRALTTARDDHNAFLGDGAYAGAYFDEIFLNKRVGHFLLRLLTNLGSMHLVDADRNTFNLTPEATRPGDLILQRWQSQGIGHTVIVLRAERTPSETIEVETAFGSMPRIQPKWYGPQLSKGYFTSQKSGGHGVNADGQSYAGLGGGLKRWRVTTFDGARWRNVVPDAYAADWMDADEHGALADRTDAFETLLGEMTPAEKRDLYLMQIDEARRNLSLRPASCANRIRREEAFEKLYALGEDAFGMTRAETDAAYRELEDYVFAELSYEQSKTCCWNQSTAAMYAVAMDYNEALVWDDDTRQCHAPEVFKAVDGGYDVFAQHAAALGVGDAWVAWSADESCPQAGTLDDVEADHGWAPFCEVAEAVLGLEDPTPGGGDDGGDGDGGDDSGGDDSGGSTPGGGDSGGDVIDDSLRTCGQCQGGPGLPPLAGLLFLLAYPLWTRTRARRRDAERPCAP